MKFWGGEGTQPGGGGGGGGGGVGGGGGIPGRPYLCMKPCILLDTLFMK